MQLYIKFSVIIAVMALVFLFTGKSYSSEEKDLPRRGQWVWYDCIVVPDYYEICTYGGNGECLVGEVRHRCGLNDNPN